MGTGNSGRYTFSTGSTALKGYVDWTETYDDSTYLTTNQTTVTQKAYIYRTNTYSGNYNIAAKYTRTFYFGSETVGTTAKATLTVGPNPPGDPTLVYEASMVITHDADGAKSITLGFEADTPTVDVGGYDVSKVTSTVTLMTVPRASSISNTPSWTAPGSVTCNISRKTDAFTHTVWLDVTDSNGTWQNIGSLTGQGASATFNTEAVMKNAYTYLAQRASTSARFRIQTYNGSTAIGSQVTSGTGTCYAANANTATAPTFTATNSATTTITKGNSSFTSYAEVWINSQCIGSYSGGATSWSFNTDVTLRTRCFTGLAQNASLSYLVRTWTYYSGVQVQGYTDAWGTCNAPAVNTITAPTWTGGYQFSSTVSTADSALSRAVTLQIADSSGNWVTVQSSGVTSSTTITWDGSSTTRDIIFPTLNGRTSTSSRFLLTTYYNGVQVRGANAVTSGTCTAPTAISCNAPTWYANQTYSMSFSYAFPSWLECSSYVDVKDSSGSWYRIFSGGFSNYLTAAIAFNAYTEKRKECFQVLAQAASRETRALITTYYVSSSGTYVQVRSTVTVSGTLNAPAASTLSTTPSWIAGDSMTCNISRVDDNFTHTLVISVGGKTKTITGIGTSTTFGTSEADRILFYEALNSAASASVSTQLTTYYSGVQVRTATSASGTLSAPSVSTITIPTWTAGNSFTATITPSKDYLVNSIQLKVNNTVVEKYDYQTVTSIGFMSTTELSMLAYQALAQQASATASFIVTMYYKTSSNTYIQVNASKTTNGTCTALEASTITAPNWTAGSTFTATISKKSLNLYEVVRLKVNGQLVQEYPIQGSTSLTYALTFANTKDINTKIYSALAQAASKTATLEIVTYFGTSTTNVQQVRSTVVATGVCNASEAVVGNLTLSQTPAIIDNTEITCNLTKALSDYTVVIDVSCNGVVITSLTPADTETSAIFNSADYVNELYQSIPTQKSGALQFKVITYYNGVQVQQPKTVAVDINANEETVKIKINEEIALTTKANVFTEIEKVFIDDTSMIASKLSNLAISIAEGYFYLENKYGGYITQIKAQISNSSGMMQTFSFTSNDVILNNEKTRIVSTAFLDTDAIVMGPYDFMDVTTAGTVYNLNIVATDSRGYSTTKVIPLKIFPYSAPTIKLDKKATVRGTGDNNKYCIINLNGTISSLFTESTGEKVQTNLIDTLSLEYKTYGSTGAYSIYNITAYTYNDTYTAYNLTSFSTAGTGISDFDISSTYELKVTVKDAFGKTNSDSIIILPDRPALSFRDQRIGINIIPRKLGSFIERESTDDENPSLDVNGYIYSNGREVPTFVYQMKENDEGELVIDEWTI